MLTLHTARYLLPISSPPLERGGILLDGERILAVGSFNELQQQALHARVVDHGDRVLLPPMVNAHTHLELTHFPQWLAAAGETAEPTDFVGWIERMIRIKRALEPQQYQASLADGISACLKVGTGAVGDNLSVLSARSAHRDSPLFGRLYYEAIGRQPEQTRERRLQIAALLDEGHCGRLLPGLAPHAPYTLSTDYLREMLQFAEVEGIPCSMHLGESLAEREFLLSSSGPLAERLYPLVGWQDLLPEAAGLSPVAYLAAQGGLKQQNLLVHGLQVDAAELQQLAAAGVTMTLCPRSNARLKVGFPPVELYRQAGVRLALGTDSLASNDSLSLWDELAFAWLRFSGSFSAEEMLQIVTCNGADALGLTGELGRLEPESGANFQVVELAAATSLEMLPQSLCEQGADLRVAGLVLCGKECLPSRG